MRKINQYSVGTGVTNLALLSALAALTAGCVVQAPAYRPPPPPVAYSAPPPAYSEPGAVTVQVEPPALPVYEQPPCPQPGYMWTPGYWAWQGGGYYWVPGTWVSPPQPGVYWTPAFWGFVGGAYIFHAGYWGPHVGFYGGINYGGGYGGSGYYGGRWQNGAFAYNRAVTNVNTTVINNTYNETVVNNVTVNRVSYNGGPSGTTAAPTTQELAAAREPHVAPTPAQVQHVQQASQNHALYASVNQGHPTIAATPRPGAFTGPGVVAAHSAAAPPATSTYHPQGNTAPGAPGYRPPPATPTAPANATYHAPPANPPANSVNHAAPPPATTPPPKPKPQEHEHEEHGEGRPQ